LKLEQYGFNVFAGSQAVDAKIHAVTGEMPSAHITDLDCISQTAGGLDPEVGEDGMRGCGIRDAKRFLEGALAALIDFIGIGCAPVVSWRLPSKICGDFSAGTA